jgi:adenylosuccinate synthase
MERVVPRVGDRQADVIVGIQWGDEGKGRIIDYYAADYDVVARFGGGDNAGHTIIVGARKLALRIVPSAVLQTRPLLFIGGGTVVGLRGLIDELHMLAGVGVDVARVKISDRAHVVLPYHISADAAAETARGDQALGTTRRGIGPAYTDKAARAGLEFGDLRSPDVVAERIRADGRGGDALIAETLALAKEILPHVVDGVAFLHGALEGGKRILVEGAQGTMLDVGYGTYPFVTSSHTIAGGACTGLGIGPRAIGNVVGVAKAYCTRVGAGPFPSELGGKLADRLRVAGGEFGTVTGRARRCGWFDAVAGRYATRVNGLTSAIITKLDVLSGFDRIGIVTDYELDGASVGVDAMTAPGLTAQVEWYDGWDDDITGAHRMGDLPARARNYVAALEAALTVPIEAVSVGPERAALLTSP